VNNRAIEARDKLAKIYLIFGAIFIAIFLTISILALFFSALNF
jgi:hypothetical protein